MAKSNTTTSEFKKVFVDFKKGLSKLSKFEKFTLIILVLLVSIPFIFIPLIVELNICTFLVRPLAISFVFLYFFTILLVIFQRFSKK
jgi:hypothetical protein